MAPVHYRGWCLRLLELAAMGPDGRERGLAELARRGVNAELHDEVRGLLPPPVDPRLRRWVELQPVVRPQPARPASFGSYTETLPVDRQALARLSPADQALALGPAPCGGVIPVVALRRHDEAAAKLLEHLLDDMDAHPEARRRLEDLERSRGPTTP
jgi:hypothetical protein